MKAWSVSQLVQRADLVVMGEVESSESRWHKSRIHTWNELSVDSIILGEAPSASIQVRHLGGSMGDYQLTIPGAPHFEKGDHVLLFLRQDSIGHAFHVVGLSQGVFQLAEGESSETISQDITGGMLEGPALVLSNLSELLIQIHRSAR